MSPRFEHAVRRAVANRRIFPYLVVTTAGLAALAGFVVTVIDRKDFPDFGTGVWSAIVTIATVGYGDVVPHTGWGRVVGGAVIVVGGSFVSFLSRSSRPTSSRPRRTQRPSANDGSASTS
jgi:voltage-gated potassium channel